MFFVFVIYLRESQTRWGETIHVFSKTPREQHQRVNDELVQILALIALCTKMRLRFFLHVCYSYYYLFLGIQICQPM